MHDNEFTAFSKRAWKHGYTAQMSAGPPTRDRWCQPRGKNGVITLISRNLAHSHAFSISGDGGQAVASWVDGTLCVNVYVAHSTEQACFSKESIRPFMRLTSMLRLSLCGIGSPSPLAMQCLLCCKV